MLGSVSSFSDGGGGTGKQTEATSETVSAVVLEIFGAFWDQLSIKGTYL